MKLYYNKNSKDPTYYVQQGIRIGKKTTTRNVKSLGKHSELLKITDDPLAYVKEEIRKINEEHRVGRVEITYTVDFNAHVDPTEEYIAPVDSYNIGYFFLQYIMCHLQLKEFFKNITEDRKISFDCFTINRFLIYARIMYPMSKFRTWHMLSTFYERPKFDYQHILRYMDILEEHYDEYLTWLYNKSNNLIKRNSSILYYDCTNFYFEINKADEDFVDPVTGEIIKGLRQFGVSKEHRPNPLVEMGLFLDSQGIPITMCLHPGNTSEQQTAIPLEEEVLKMIPGAKFIYCADAGLGSYNIRKFNSMGGRAFIVSQSVKKLSDVLKKAVFEDYDYRLLSNDEPISLEYMQNFDKYNENNLSLYNDAAYKVIEADKAVDLGLYEDVIYKNGRKGRRKATGIIKQYVIIKFSRKMMEYQRAVRNSQIEIAKNRLRKNDPETIKKGPNDANRFLKRVVTTSSGEDAKVQYVLDEERIKEEEKYDGFYAVATNLEDPAKDILEIAGGRYKIEECFRIMKTTFEVQPVYHRLPKRITAHFMICFTALLVFQLLRAKLDNQGTHFTEYQIIETLRRLNVDNINDIEYFAPYKGCKVLTALVQLTMLPINMKFYTPKELNRMIKKILK